MKAKLSMAFEDLRGKDGNVVISKGRTGLMLRPRVRGRNPKSAAQLSVRAALGKASGTFKAFTPAQVAAWTAYAATIVKRNPITGKSYNPTPINAFVALASKFLQINPTGTIPLTPPAGPFTGDNITLTALGGTGKVTFTASAANSLSTKTELLLQPLKSKNRVPGSKGYRTKGFVAFAAGSLSSDVNVPAGSYAAAFRFVNVTTGQETALQILPVQLVSFAVEQGGRKQDRKAA